jgi:hypothetical protein
MLRVELKNQRQWIRKTREQKRRNKTPLDGSGELPMIILRHPQRACPRQELKESYPRQVPAMGENVPSRMQGKALLDLCVGGDEDVEEGDGNGESGCRAQPGSAVHCHRRIGARESK